MALSYQQPGAAKHPQIPEYPLFDAQFFLEEAEEIGVDTRELYENLNDNKSDFEIGNYRFINSDDIDKIQQDELSSDPYVLGCFNADFLADIIGWHYDAVKAVQDAEKYETIGQFIIDNDHIEELQEEYSRLDGYGHHFAHYDHHEHELFIGDDMYYYFRTN